MEKIYFSSEVCKQLTSLLVKEQAELLEHEALVKAIKAKLIEGKQQIIRKLIERKTFHIEGKRMTALEILFCEDKNKLCVNIEMGLDPDREVRPYSLTRTEEQLLEKYRKLLMACCDNIDGIGEYTLETAHRLANLKNHIYITRCYYWEIDLGNTETPGFFEQSSLQIRDDFGYRMLEDLEVNC